MMIFASTMFHRCRKGMLALLVCGSVLSSVLMASLISVPLMLFSPQAMATCTPSGDAFSKTFIYTAANINNAATLPFTISWTCRNGNNVSTSAHVCYKSVFDGTALQGANTLPYTVGFTDTGNTVAKMTSGTVYGLYNNPVGGSSSLKTTVNVNIATGQAAALAVGTYTDNNIQFAFDQQGNGAPCEGNFVPSDANWDSYPAVYSANFVVPSSCALITQNETVDFGNLTTVGPLGTAVNKTASLKVKCNSGAAYTVYLGDGNQRISGGYRQMKNGTALLPYQLYKDSARTQVWDETGGTTATGGTGGVNGTGAGTDQTLTVYAQIPAGVVVPGTLGTYTDTVIVTVTY